MLKRTNFKKLARGFTLGAVAVLGFAPFAAMADDYAPGQDIRLGIKPDPQKGYELILNAVMSSPIMKIDDIDRVWQVWEAEEKAKAEKATPAERRKMTFTRYGWATRPGSDTNGLPLDYTADDKGNLVTNCFSCHGGMVEGKPIPGAGNGHVDLTALATDVLRLRKLDNGGDPSTVKDVIAPFGTPLNFHRGVTNAVIFAPMFAALRDPQYAKMITMNPGILHHHDMNAPAWWNVKKKNMLYCDQFAPKTPRQLMPFAMSPSFTEEKFRSFEPNFVHIEAYIENLQPPKYPKAVDAKLASKGREAFEMSCARCHGTYGENAKYPNKIVPLKELGTDPVRLTAITEEMRKNANENWLQYGGEYPIRVETAAGYVAPPLDGIWASAPYFHNGSVPTLHGVLNSKERPKVWKADDEAYDHNKMGLLTEVFDAVPATDNTRLRRYYYDTTHVGSSAAGHMFPDEDLNADEKVAVLEYLKTL